MKSPIQVALVGAGNMGSLHARVIAQSPDAELAYIVDPREDVGTEVAQRFGTTWKQQLGDLSSIDAVVLAAATEAHYSLAKEVLASGKALLVEKPVSDSLLRSQEIIDLAHSMNAPIMCGLLERFNPAVLTALTIMETPLHVTTKRHSQYAARIRTGVAWDLLIHDIDLLLQIVKQPVETVSSSIASFHPSSSPGSEDVVEAILSFSSGAIGQASASRIGQRKIRELSIYEEDRLIEVDLLRRDVTIFHGISSDATNEGKNYRQQSVTEIPEIVSAKEPLSAQFEHFVKLVRHEVDIAEERNSIIPSHKVIDDLLAAK